MSDYDWPQIPPVNEATIRAFVASRVEQDGDCLVWIGAKDSHDAPIMRIPGERRFRPVRRILATLDGVKIESKLMTVTCGNPCCIKHVAPVTRKTLQRKTSKANPYQKSVLRNKRIADSSRARLSKLTIDIVAEIRSSGLASRAVAKQYGIGQSAASDILSHRSWRIYTSPWAGL